MRKHSKDISSSSNQDNNIYSYTDKKNGKGKKNPKKKKEKRPWTVKRILLTAGKTLVALILIGVITMSLVITGLTVYVMKGSNECEISLEKDDVLESDLTVVYGMDDSGQDVEVCSMTSGTTRIWTDISAIPEDVKNAYVAVEDKRFYEHEGVDFKRTFLAFLNMFLHFWDSEQGGSTITQQLVKNLTNDDENSPARKIREISRAMSLERTYSKDQILQAYLNIVPVGGGNGDYEGVGAAAKLYFNKDISQVTLAEAASIASITKSPFYYEPIGHPDHNKERRDLVLSDMHDQGMITQTEYQEAVNTPVTTNRGKVVGSTNGKEYQSYFVDDVIREVISDLAEKKGVDTDTAEADLLSGGYKIYSTIDAEMQDALEQLYENPGTFGWNSFTDSPESAFVVYDMNGRMKAVVGGTGTKPAGDRSVLDRATQAQRRPGSSIKPLSAYALAVENNMVNYSSVVEDRALYNDAETGKPWPQNYSGKYAGNVLMNYAVEQSINTVPARLITDMTPKVSFDFLTQKVGLTGLEKADINVSPLALGNFTQGVYLNELTNAYQIFGNGGKFIDSHTYYKVEDSVGTLVLQDSETSSQVISADTSSVVNRLLRKVVTSGTGKKASLDNMGIEVVGKTGTTDDYKDYTFVGLTHDYVAGIWLGYDSPASMGNTNNAAKVWGKVMGALLSGEKQADFAIDSSVIQADFCTSSGGLATSRCPKTETGYYRASNQPSTCTVH